MPRIKSQYFINIAGFRVHVCKNKGKDSGITITVFSANLGKRKRKKLEITIENYLLDEGFLDSYLTDYLIFKYSEEDIN